jgi:DNA invertase Pin-like site-specific DNA recombinase
MNSSKKNERNSTVCSVYDYNNFSKRDKNIVKRLYEKEFTPSSIGFKLGIPRHMVMKILFSTGTYIRSISEVRRLKFTEDEILKVKQMYEQGSSASSIGSKLGLHHNVVKKHLLSTGTRIRTRSENNRLRLLVEKS